MSSQQEQQQSTKFPETMKACTITGYGTKFSETCVYSESYPFPLSATAKPSANVVNALKPNQVLIKVHAAAVNPAEVKLAEGIISIIMPIPTFPYVLGNDIVGDIVQVGSPNSKFKVGNTVFGERIMCAHAEYAIIDEERLALVPKELPLEEAAAAPSAIITAYQSLIKAFPLGSKQPQEESILVLGASGGVGSYTVLLAKHVFKFKQVIGTCSGKNVDYVKSLGADLVIDYTKEHYVTALKRQNITVTVVLSNIGEYSDNAYPIMKPASKHGRFLSVGGPPYLAEGGLWNIVRMACSTVRCKFWSLFDYPYYEMIMAEGNGKDMEVVAKIMVEHKLIGKVRIEKVPLKECRRAYEHCASQRTVGKIILTMDSFPSNFTTVIAE